MKKAFTMVTLNRDGRGVVFLASTPRSLSLRGSGESQWHTPRTGQHQCFPGLKPRGPVAKWPGKIRAID